MKIKTAAVRSTLGWLLLAACVIMTLWGTMTGHHPAADPLRCSPNGIRTAVEEIVLQPGRIPVNTADVSQLTELPGVGESTAQAMIDERLTNGPFYYPEDLMHVRGIGEKKLQAFREWLDLTEK